MRSRFGSVVLLLIYLGISFIGSQLSSAQANIGGGLRGTVTDQRGAYIDGGFVTLQSSQTETERQTPIVAGVYRFDAVEPGLYTVKIDKPGYKQVVLNNVDISLNEIRALNAALPVGAVTDTVIVTDEYSSPVTQQTSILGLLKDEAIQELPVNGRDFQNLAYLAPGTSRSSGGTGQGSGLVASGARPTNNNYLIDGGDANDPIIAYGAVGNVDSAISSVPLDALEQFSVITSNAGAEFGRSSGGVVSVVTKSGSNGFHASAWEFIRNSAVNARGFFDDVDEKTPYKSNQFGVRAGGTLQPNKFFYSVAYEGYRRRSQYTGTVYVPTQELLATIKNAPLKALMSAFYPSISGASSPTTISSGTATTTRSVSDNVDGDTGFARLDRNFSAKNKAFATFSLVDYAYNATNASAIQGNGNGVTSRPYHIVVDDTHLFSNHLYNDARFAFQRNIVDCPPEANTAAQLAAGSSRTAGPYAGTPYSSSADNANGVPTVSFSSGSFSSIGQPYYIPRGRASNVFSYQDAISWELGRHQIKAGLEFRRIQENSHFGFYTRPSIIINDTSLANLQAGAVSSQTQYTYLDGNSERGYRSTEQGYFVQDTWQATPRLTINAGLRYEIFPPFSEVRNRLYNAFVLDSSGRPKACTPLPFGSGLSGVAVLNAADYGIKPYCADYNNFAPRLGLSYDLTGKGSTVISAAYGVYFDRTFSNAFSNMRYNAPQVANITSYPTSFDGTQSSGAISTTQAYNVVSVDPSIRTPYTQRFNLTASQQVDKDSSLTLSYVGSIGTKLIATERPNMGASFPAAFRPSNQGTTARLQTDIDKGTITAPFGNFIHRTSNAASNFHSLEATYKRRFAHNIAGQVTYSYSRSRDNMSNENSGSTDTVFPAATYDNLLASYLAPGSTCSGVASSYRNASVITAESVYTAAMRCATGNTSLTTAEAATQFVSSYLKFHPLGANYGDSSFDVRQRIAGYVSYTLPKVFAGKNRLLSSAANEWQVSSIVEAQTGIPLLIYSGYDSNRDGDTVDYATLVSGTTKTSLTKTFSPSGPSVKDFDCSSFDSSAHTRTCSTGGKTVVFGQALGTTDPSKRIQRGTFRQPGIFNLDLRVAKLIRINEKVNANFSADAFNLLNHANFGTVGSTITASSFGQSTSQNSLGQTASRQIQFGLRFQY